MSLFGGLYVGASGIQTSSNSLNTVAHNLSNVDTTGYTRQSASQATRNYNILSKSNSHISYQEVGLGVKYAEVRQVRDHFLDKTYRKESGRSAFYEVSHDTMTQVEDLLGESGDNNFQESISDVWKTVQELANDPSSAVTQGLFVSKAQTLLERATNVYNSICDYQMNLNTQVKTMVDQLNKYGHRLKELNDAIVKIEIGGYEHANDLRDERNLLLDQMAELVDISYVEDIDGYVSVQIEGTDFVKRDDVYEIGVQADEYGFYTPFWIQNASLKTLDGGEQIYDMDSARVFDLKREISSDIDTDIGKLKATMLARGDHFATAEDLKNPETYNRDIAQSICMNIAAEFDQLVSNIVTSINDILKEAGYTDSEGEGLFLRNVIQPEWEDKASDKDEQGWYTSNVYVNPKFLQQPTLISMMKPDGSVDYETATKLKDAFNEQKYVLNPNTTKASSFIEYYSDLVTQVANSGSVYKHIAENQSVTKEEAAFAREQVLGVSSDEELQKMITYQNAYNASSRYITTINDMLESMMNAFGAS